MRKYFFAEGNFVCISAIYIFLVSLDLQCLLSEEKDHDLILYLFVIGKFF
jgi:hypothetical protein